MRTTVLLSVLFGIWLPLQAASVSGELRKWHKVTLSFNGPSTSESATPNPFTNYRLDVTFRHAGSGKSYVVPGYYAADGNAANTSASSGNVWRTHFAPDETGTWTYDASFRSGTNVYAGNPGSGSSAGFFDGDSGSFTVADTNKTGRDLRGKGLLQYVGKHHLRFAGTGTYFMKAGVDSPENLLSYADFDGNFKTDGEGDDLVKDWQPHVGDWHSGDPVWQGSKGKGLIGAINYLASEGLNSFSFLTMNINGDDKNVFPYIDYDSRDRLDVSRLEQWEIVFEHGTRNGMYLHFKTQETENELLLDGGNLGNQRKLYYRELIARFGHNLALNWNLGEEVNDASTSQKKAWAQYFHDVDPYDHHIVIHNGDSHTDLMGPGSELTGMSWQANASNFSDTFSNVLDYIEDSVTAGKPWVVACDEPGDAQLSLRPDNDPGNSHTDARRDALWATFMAGGAGIEFYFGYGKPQSDLTCEDFRSRDSFWDYCRYAIEFFESGAVPFQDMSNHNELVSGSGDNLNRCLAKPGQSYLVQLRSGGTHTLNLSGASGSFRVRWLDTLNGGSLITGNTVSGGGTVSLGAPPNSTTQNWIVLVDKTTGGTPDNQAPVVSAGPDRNGTLSGSSATLTLSGSATDDGLPESGTLTTSWTRVSGPAGVSFATPNSPSTNASFSAAGTYVLRLTANDGEFSRSDDVTVTITSSSGGGETLSFVATQDAYTENGTNRNLSSIRVESSSRMRIAYLQFDVQGFVSATNATLKLTESDDDSAGTMTLRLYAGLSNDWSQTTITSSNAPGKGALLDTFTGDITDGKEVSFDASAFVTGPGTYTLILEADPSSRDVAFAASENSVVAARPELVVTTGGASPPNEPPVVNAGADQTATMSASTAQVQLDGTASDDGLPPGSSLSVTWSLVSGPATPSFSSSNTPSTQVTFTQAGSYTLRLTATDGALTSSDDVIVTVNPQPPTNQPPVVSAGPDRTATLSGGQATLAIDGSASDDGLPSGSSLAVAWSRVSGPAAVTFSSPSSPDTNATFPTAGTYVLRLSGSDGSLTSTDDTTVVISSAPGGGTQTAFQATQDAYTENGITRNVSSIRVESSERKRIAYIQFDVQGIASATNAILKLTESDDDSAGTMTIRLYAALSNNWSEDTITGSNAPGKGALLDTFIGDISDGKEVSFDASAFITGPGTYTLILEADPSSRDIAFAATENSVVSARPELAVASGGAPPPNAAPAVSAGADQTATMGSSTAQVQLNGAASDDGLPAGSSLAVTWSRVSGPAAVSFSSSNTPSTQVTFNQAGSYTLRLTATDGALTSSDDVIVTVNPQPPTNQPPVVSAGPDRTATLSGGQATSAIDGSASDDGLPAGSTLTVAWSRVSGPAAVTFSSPSSPDTDATFTAAGTYVLRLSGSDGTLTAADDTTVVISSAPGGGTQTQFLPTHDAYTEDGSNRNGSNLRIESTSRKRIGFLQFDLSTAVSPISSATLELTEDDDVSVGSMTLRLFAATSNSWSESTVSGSNDPAKGAELDSVTGEIGNDESITFDVSALVTAPGIYSFILEADSSPYDVAFASSENANTSARPILRVTGGAAQAQALSTEPSPATVAPPPPALSIQRMADQGIRVNMIGVAGRSYRVQRTSDLVHWETLQTVVASEEGVVDYIDPVPPETQAFYRLEWDD